MPYYDAETKAAFEARHGRPTQRFLANTDDPNDDIETADFLRDRIWAYCQEVMAYVRQFHPTAVFECLWPLDANQGKPTPDPEFRALNFHVNLPNEWKTSALNRFLLVGRERDLVLEGPERADGNHVATLGAEEGVEIGTLDVIELDLHGFV